MRARTLILIVGLIASMAATGARAEAVRGVVFGQLDDCTHDDENAVLTLRMVGRFTFGYRPYDGVLNVPRWLKPCAGGAAHSTPFHGANKTTGVSVAGTCIGDYSRPLLPGAVLDCSGQVTDAKGTGPLGTMKMHLDYRRIENPSICSIGDCGFFDDPIYTVVGTFTKV